MGKIVVVGGNKLKGSIRINGAKNTVLPILAATLLNAGENIIHDCPALKDVSIMIKILEFLGCNVKREGSTIIVDSTNINNYKIPDDLMREMRSSVILMGPIISRYRKAFLSYPGGCEIGHRPIDLHLKALRQLGVSIEEGHGYIHCETKGIVANDINLSFPSVGATENVMLAAIMAEGTTVIRNVAKEPEIWDLQNYLNAMGAKVSGAGTSVLVIEGVKRLKKRVEYTLIPDRIVAATYLIAAAITKGCIELSNANAEHLQAVLAVLRETGCIIYTTKDSIVLHSNGIIYPVDLIRTLPYPGFPTDSQAMICSLLCLAEGTSIISETIFENRFKHVEELTRMGADIKVDGRVAVIKGVKRLTGANVDASDLRGGAALILAGLAAEGATSVGDIFHIDRGYERIEEKLKHLGANIKRVD